MLASSYLGDSQEFYGRLLESAQIQSITNSKYYGWLYLRPLWAGPTLPSLVIKARCRPSAQVQGRH